MRFTRDELLAYKATLQKGYQATVGEIDAKLAYLDKVGTDEASDTEMKVHGVLLSATDRPIAELAALVTEALENEGPPVRGGIIPPHRPDVHPIAD